MADAIAAVAGLATILYALLGGADFGGGVWDAFATGVRKADQRSAIAHAMGPVWEANHVWLIFVIVISVHRVPERLRGPLDRALPALPPGAARDCAAWCGVRVSRVLAAHRRRRERGAAGLGRGVWRGQHDHAVSAGQLPGGDFGRPASRDLGIGRCERLRVDHADVAHDGAARARALRLPGRGLSGERDGG